MTDTPTIAEEKAKMRKTFRRLRLEVEDSESEAAGLAVAGHGLSFLNLQRPHVVSAYYPSRGELNCLPLMEDLQRGGHQLALPMVTGKGEPLSFRAWTFGAPLVEGSFQIPVPDAGAPLMAPEIFLVPLLAFNDQGYRLGYGGGFYDRTLSQARTKGPIVTVGLAYDFQRTSSIPHDTFDEPLDFILTPSGVITAGNARHGEG